MLTRAAKSHKSNTQSSESISHSFSNSHSYWKEMREGERDHDANRKKKKISNYIKGQNFYTHWDQSSSQRILIYTPIWCLRKQDAVREKTSWNSHVQTVGSVDTH